MYATEFTEHALVLSVVSQLAAACTICIVQTGCLLLAAQNGGVEEGGVEENDHHREEQAIHAVEDAAVARDERAAVLHLGHPLQQRLRQVAERGEDGDQDAQNHRVIPGHLRRGERENDQRGDD